jgi:tetratricopeptide (TPR) repeat protein
MRKVLTLSLLLAASLSASYAQVPDVKVGDKVTVDGKEYWIGRNEITNPHFSDVDEQGNITGWSVGDYTAMTKTNWTWHETGGTDGGAWIQTKGAAGASDTKSLGTRWAISPNAKYYFSFWVTGYTKTDQYIVASLTAKESTHGGMNEDYLVVGKGGTAGATTGFGTVKVPSSKTEWAQNNLFFDSGDYTYLQFNARWMPTNSYGFDNFYLAKLYDASTTDPSDLMSLELAGLVEEAQALEDGALANYSKMVSDLADAVLQYGEAGADADATKANYDSLSNKIAECRAALKVIPQLKSLIDNSQVLVAQTSYPGLDAFTEALDAAASVYDNTDTSAAGDYGKALTALQEAVKRYRLSQVATKESPADYSFLIQHPWFCNDENVPKSLSAEDIAAANQSATVLNSTGWVNGSTNPSSGDQRLGFSDCTCWNAWSVNFSGYLDIHQNLTNLPNGLYSIKCYGKTQPGCINDQHAYAKTAFQTVASNVMTVDSSAWEQLSTADNGLAIVSDGTLTIGMTGTHDPAKVSDKASDGRNGWFCATGFQLYYYGAVALDDLKKVYADKLASCQAQADTMLFKGDKTAYQQVITDNTGKDNETDIYAALKNLSDAQSQANASISKQRSYLTGICKQVGDSIAANAYDDKMMPVMQTALNFAKTTINADAQTYTCYDAIAASLTSYAKTYLPEYKSVLEALSSISSQDGIKAVNATIDEQLKELSDSLLSSTKVAEMTEWLATALRQAQACDIVASGTKDYTALIVNPDCEKTNASGLVGWTVKHPSGTNMSNVKEQYDGVATGRYIDCYYSTSGALLFNAYQTITNLPNGTYKLTAMGRTSGKAGAEGNYIYTISDNDSVNGVKLAMIKRTQTNITEATSGQIKAADGTDSIAYALGNLYGDIWLAAAKNTNYGTTGSEADLAIYSVNASKGFGWQNIEFETEVKNHILTIGVTTDSTFTLGRKDIDGNACVPFSGTWLSADNFTLTLIANGDNQGWSPVTAIESLKADDNADTSYRIYNLNGVQMNAASTKLKGIYIIKTRNSVKKIVIR